MEAIKTYMDNVFAGFEQTPQVATLKRDMLISMEEKYFALKGEGKSENEAVGCVIADFGSVEEIAAELGQAQPVLSDIPTDSIPLSRDDAFDFVNQMKKRSLWIGFGVWIVLAGVAAMLLLGNFGIDDLKELKEGFELSSSRAAGIFMLLLAVAGAVPIFIVHGMALSRFEVFESTPILLDRSTRAELEAARKQYIPRFAAFMAVGVAIVLLAVGGLIMLLTLDNLVIGVPVAMLLFAVGAATMFFINGGMTFGAYEILLGVGEYVNKKASEKADRLIGTVAATFFPAMTAVYLLWSFLGNAWHISWLIWPIAGVLFGAFAGGLSVWSENN